MTPLHIVMVGVPAHGHMNPHLPVLAELVARGHRVDVTTPSGFAPAVTATGATVVPVTSVLPDEDRGETWPDDPVAGMARFLDEGVHVLPQARAALDGDRPDVLLGDIGSYPARVLAHQWSRPLVQLSTTYVAWESYEHDMAEVLDGLRAAPGYAAYHGRFAAWLSAEGVPLDVDAFTGRPPRSVVLAPGLCNRTPTTSTHAAIPSSGRPWPSACTSNSGPSRTARSCWSPSAPPTRRRPRSTAPASTPSPTSTATS